MKPGILISILLVAGHAAFGQQFMFVFLNKKVQKDELPKDQVEKIMAGHLANIERLAKEGKLIAAGPFDGGGGIFIFSSNSVAQVTEWLSTDPGVQAKRWDIEILPYSPRTGSVCSVKEPYEMMTYDFVRFSVNPASSAESRASNMISHDKFLAGLAAGTEVKVIAEGTFGADAGGILITNGGVMDKIAMDPAIQHAVMTTGSKKLYIARGAFCEK